MPAPIVPWMPSNIPREIQEELNRRKINRSFKFVQNAQASWDVNSSGNSSWKSYRGPMVSWIRMCSNGAGHPLTQPPRERFVLFSGKGFYQTYGFSPPQGANKSMYQVIGYTPEGEEHRIENSLTAPSGKDEGNSNWPIHVPPPEISKMEVLVQKELFRRAQIELVCFSWKQLVYMTPYFLVPGITCMVEWGWNHYNVKSLVDLANRDTMQKLWDNAYPLYFKNILYSNGNYDVIYGIVTNFNWSVEGNKYICSVEITSKDRLYAGIAKDYALSVSDKSGQPSVFQSIKDFITKDDTAKALRTLVTTPNVVGEEATLVSTGVGSGETWRDILNPLLYYGTPEVKIMRRPYVFGLFSGRGSLKDSPAMNSELGPAKNKDWDYKVEANHPTHIWINMGMVVQILNYYSATDSGAGKGQNTFYVDIQNTVIGAHPNMISCDPRVLIPSSNAPKYHWGTPGQNAAGPKSPYFDQVHTPISFDSSDKKQIPNKVLSTIFYQGSTIFYEGSGRCYRNDIDGVINYNRYKYGGNSPAGFAFPSDVTQKLPITYRGLRENEVVAERSGLLSNIYIRFDVLKSAVDDVSSKTPSYADIYTYIFKILQDAVDGFWELSLIDVDGVFTVSDKKYIGKFALNNTIDVNGKLQEGPETVYSFDYYDADSIIKSIKFKPQLSDAQATRTIYGAVNNKDSKYKYLDKNDVLDYQFRDCVIGPADAKRQGDVNGELAKRTSAKSEHEDLIRKVQTINNKTDDPSLQMSLVTDGGTDLVPNIVKLVLPDQQLLRMLLNDDDDENNARYCAVQPGIVLELTLLGIGGLRTFQYFTVKNLPEPYSDRNIIFRITDVQQTLEAGNWETTIRAQPSPLRAYIRHLLQGPIPIDSSTPNDNGWPILNSRTS